MYNSGKFSIGKFNRPANQAPFASGEAATTMHCTASGRVAKTIKGTAATQLQAVAILDKVIRVTGGAGLELGGTAIPIRVKYCAGTAGVMSNWSAAPIKTTKARGKADIIAATFGGITRVRYATGYAPIATELRGRTIRILRGVGKADIAIAGTGNAITTRYARGTADATLFAYATAVTSDEALIDLSSVVIPANSVLTIDTQDMTVTLDGVNVIHHLQSSSDFFKLLEGDNIITLQGQGGARIKVSWRARYI